MRLTLSYIFWLHIGTEVFFWEHLFCVKQFVRNNDRFLQVQLKKNYRKLIYTLKFFLISSFNVCLGGFRAFPIYVCIDGKYLKILFG